MTTEEEQKVVEQKEEKEENAQSSDDEHEHEHEHLDPSKKANRGEKKFKKAMGKMGLKPVSGINRVTIKKGKAFVISIDDPDIWKSPGNENAYIVFGKPNLDGAQTGQSEMNQFNSAVNPEGPTEEKPKTQTPVQSEVPKQEEAEEDLNEEGISPDNIKMVMEYTKCSKAEAIRALRETEDDSVNAIMKLTK